MNGLFRSTLALGLAGCAAQPGWVDDRFFIRVDDADLYVHAVGEGTSNKFVLLLHDEPAQGAGGYELSPAAPALHEEMVMIYLDQRGAGASQTRTAPSDITLDLLTDDIVSVIDVLEPMYLEPRTGHPELWLMGHGWGGMLGPSVLFETDASDRLAGWIEVAGAHDFPKVHEDSAIQLLDAADRQLAEDLDAEARADWTAIQQTARSANQTPEDLDEFLTLQRAARTAIRLTDEVQPVTIPLRDRIAWDLQHPAPNGSPSAVAQAVTRSLLDAELQTSWSEQYRTLELPTLLLNGQHNFVVPSTLNDDAQLRIASDHVDSVLFEESAHHPMFEEPDAYATAIVDFVGASR